LQDQCELNKDNLSNVRQEGRRHFRNKKTEYLKDRINNIESNSRNMNIRELYRHITEFKKCYQPPTNLVKDERVEKSIQALVGKPEGKRPLGRLRCSWEDGSRGDWVREGVWSGFSWFRIGLVVGCCEHGYEPSGSGPMELVI
jgi:hypothetical protein